MTNAEAMAALSAREAAIGAAMAKLAKYNTDSGDWKAAVKTARKAEIKTLATEGGVDLADWKG